VGSAVNRILSAGRIAAHIGARPLFYLSLAFTLATQIRGLTGGLGIAEIMGATFILLMTLRGLGSSPVVPVGFAAIFVFGYLMGGALNLFSNLSHVTVPRDFVAIVYAILYGLAVIALMRTERRAMLMLSVAFTWAILVQIVPLVLMARGYSVHAWMGDDDKPGLPFVTRYTGFSDNPNQLGMLLCSYPFIVLGGIREGNRVITSTFLIGGLLGGVLLALLVQSNTVFAAYMVAGTLGLVLKIGGFGGSVKTRNMMILRLTAVILIAVLFFAVFLWYASDSIGKSGVADANGRFERWSQAIEGISRSYAFGVGPGAQSGETAPFQDTEAHNVILDVVLQGGFISGLAYCGLVIFSIRRTIRIRNIWVFCALAGILTEQMAHYTIRQPINWIYLLLPYGVLSARVDFMTRQPGRTGNTAQIRKKALAGDAAGGDAPQMN
jgi:O-antigen ligase